MTNSTLGKLARIRHLVQSDPRLLDAAHFAEGGKIPDSLPAPLREFGAFLKWSNGAGFGLVGIWPWEYCQKSRIMADSLPGGCARWLCIGLIVEDHLAIDLTSGELSKFDSEPDAVKPPVPLGRFDSFLESLLGPKYERVMDGLVDDDPWWELLKELDFR